MPSRISVVTPTLHRPAEVADLLDNLSRQQHLPDEVILVDGAPVEEKATEQVVAEKSVRLPFRVHYIRQGGGTAIQRNVGIDAATGDFIAFIDDDIRLEPDFFEQMLKVFTEDAEMKVGGIAGYIINQFLDPEKSPRWRWYRRLHLFTTYEPGRYDYQTGSPINRYLQPPHDGLREIDFMGAGCALWRRQVFVTGLRFSTFFKDYGILEDAHFALRAGRDWKLLENGRAHCIHLKSPTVRASARQVTKTAAINHRFVFMDIVPQRTLKQEFRFWRLQFFDLLRLTGYALLHENREDWSAALGKWEGILLAIRLNPVMEGSSI